MLFCVFLHKINTRGDLLVFNDLLYWDFKGYVYVGYHYGEE